MRLSRLSSLTALALTAGLLSQAYAAQVSGKKGNCSAVWETGPAAVTVGNAKSTLTCTDGDPTCDGDGLPNGICVINLTACVGEASATCTPGTLTSLTFTPPTLKKLTGFIAPPVTPAGSCGLPGALNLPLIRVPKNTGKPLKKFKNSKKATLVMKSKGFLNKLVVQCVPVGVVQTTASCPKRESPGLPSQITLTVPLADRTNPQAGNGSDLDNGWTGTSHNFPVIGGSSLKYCLSGCDGTTTFQCTGSGPTDAGGATGSLNGATFGAPLPLLAANVPVCVVNVYQDATLNGTFNLQTGEAGTAASPNLVHLDSMVYLRASFPEVCPRCNVPGGGGGIGSIGKCSSTAQNSGANCRVDGEVTVAGKGLYLLSSACTPLGDNPPSGLDIKLPFTTGTAPPLVGPLPCGDSAGPQTQDDACGNGSCNSPCAPGSAACVATNAKGECIDAKGGISQLCCSSSPSTPCFPTKGGGSITRTGSPGTDGQTLLDAATFCIARTNSTLINVTTGLPGPGALLLPAMVSVSKSQ
jgi:hypothetical protein